VYEEFKRRPTPLDKWLALQALQDRNETLFYKARPLRAARVARAPLTPRRQVIIEHVEEMAPIIYTPTVGEVCLQYSRLYRRARGMYFSSEDVRPARGARARARAAAHPPARWAACTRWCITGRATGWTSLC